MKHIKFTIDITLPPDEKFLTKNDFIEAVYTCYGKQQGKNGFIIVNKDQIKTISESSGHYACVSLLDGSKLYSLHTVKEFVKLLGLKKEDEM